MSELEKRLNALYLVVEASVADDINNHVMEVVKERDALRAALEFYANESNWSRLENTNSIITDVDLCAPKQKLYEGMQVGGKRAREALNKKD